MKRKQLILAVLAAAVLATVGVGAFAVSAGAEDDADIVDTAIAAGEFTTLTMLLDRAGLVETLRMPGPYTVFAPTDAAFKKVPPKTIDALLADEELLRSVLLYHVVAGEVTSDEVALLDSAETANGQSVAIRTAGPNIFVAKAKVTTADVMASNGVIHVVNRVLIPPAGS